MTETATWTRVRTPSGEFGKRCGGCRCVNGLTVRVCRQCTRRLVRAPKKKAPPRGSAERLRLEIRQAHRQAAAWGQRVTRSVALWQKWSRRAQALERRLAAGPAPPKPRKPRQKIRSISVTGQL